LKTIKNENIIELDIRQHSIDRVKDIFIFAIGYEGRSIAILKEYFSDSHTTRLGFVFDDYKKYPEAKENYKFVTNMGLKPIKKKYDEYLEVLSAVEEQLIYAKNDFEKVNIHIDYSSMPRSWYCNLAINIKKLLRDKDRAYFWYSEGDYQQKSETWPNAGIEKFTVFNGNVSLRPTNNRSHILGLGFDRNRAHAICSVLDPSYLVVTYSYVQDDQKMRNDLKRCNRQINNLAAYSVTLPVDNFEFSISKLYETVKELHPKGDVILVPDGPKTQILAASLMPDFFPEFGVVCLHVKRHRDSYEAINVEPTGKVFGFSYGKDGFGSSQ
jgi:hypothetical protein